MFLPTTSTELKKLNWDRPDIILVSGDTYIDSPSSGVAVIGRVLAAAGFRVGIIAQPDVRSADDISRLGEPELFWGITAGAMDSMVANYTAVKKKRLNDDLTPGGRNDRRPDRSCVVYANLIRRHFKNTKPLVLGGLEASLRRIAHYDYWSNSVRRSIIFDARADILVYGMAERAVVELAALLREGSSVKDVRGICYIDGIPRNDYLELPSMEEVVRDKKSFIRMFDLFYRNNDPLTAKGLVQRHGPRFLIHNPPQPALTTAELDRIHALDFERNVHPFYGKGGKVRAMDTIKFSISSHRGCFGECNFCSIGIHEGRRVISRSEESIISEAEVMAARPDFKGYILDVGGPTANMYGIDCNRKQSKGSCENRRCLYPRVCPRIKADHTGQTRLLQKLRQIAGIKKVFIASGIRYDLLLAAGKSGRTYMQELVSHHISGQLKVAPEHTAQNVLQLMGKPGIEDLQAFKKIFEELNAKMTAKQYLTYYFIAAHPGCTESDMRDLRSFASRELKIHPQQVQIFTPTPSTYSSLMYWTEEDPASGAKIFVEKNPLKKQRQKDTITAPEKTNKPFRRKG